LFAHSKAIREKQGLLQKEVALHISIDKSTYSKIEKGMRSYCCRTAKDNQIT
jgi:DNA-binding XRE family transcriptional regulator